MYKSTILIKYHIHNEISVIDYTGYILFYVK